jgi:hypothetical protein
VGFSSFLFGFSNKRSFNLWLPHATQQARMNVRISFMARRWFTVERSQETLMEAL